MRFVKYTFINKYLPLGFEAATFGEHPVPFITSRVTGTSGHRYLISALNSHFSPSVWKSTVAVDYILRHKPYGLPLLLLQSPSHSLSLTGHLSFCHRVAHSHPPTQHSGLKWDSLDCIISLRSARCRLIARTANSPPPPPIPHHTSNHVPPSTGGNGPRFRWLEWWRNRRRYFCTLPAWEPRCHTIIFWLNFLKYSLTYSNF